MIAFAVTLLMAADVSPPDPIVVEALHRYEDCFRRSVVGTAPTMANRRAAYAAAEKACATVRGASAQTIADRWKTRPDHKDGDLVPDADRYIGLYLEGLKYQLDAEIMGAGR